MRLMRRGPISLVVVALTLLALSPTASGQQRPTARFLFDFVLMGRAPGPLHDMVGIRLSYVTPSAHQWLTTIVVCGPRSTHCRIAAPGYWGTTRFGTEVDVSGPRGALLSYTVYRSRSQAYAHDGWPPYTVFVRGSLLVLPQPGVAAHISAHWCYNARAFGGRLCPPSGGSGPHVTMPTHVTRVVLPVR